MSFIKFSCLLQDLHYRLRNLKLYFLIFSTLWCEAIQFYKQQSWNLRFREGRLQICSNDKAFVIVNAVAVTCHKLNIKSHLHQKTEA